MPVTVWAPIVPSIEIWADKSRANETWADVGSQEETWTAHTRSRSVFSALVFSRVLYLGRRVFDLGNTAQGTEGWYINSRNIEVWTPT